MPIFLVLNIGGTRCSALIGDETGTILENTSWPSRSERGSEAMLRDAFEHSAALHSKYPSIKSAGVAIGGPLDGERGIIFSPPNLPGWHQIPLKDRLSEALNLPVFVEHDAAACALAEYRWGFDPAQKPSRLVYFTCGTGFGAGIILEGRIYRGARGRNLELGHARYRQDGPAAFGKQGSYEAYCSGSALPQLAAWKFPTRWGARAPTSEELATLAGQGDPDAATVLNINAQAVGDACALVADLVVPEVIILGSLARYLGSEWLKQVRDRFESETLDTIVSICQVAPARLGERLQDLSALVVAMQYQQEP